MNEAEAIFLFAKIWGFVGLVIAVPFLIFGIDRIDEDARGAYIFRPLLIPGVILIWPMVLWRWLALERGSEAWHARYRPPREIHALFAMLCAALIIAVVAVSLSIRPQWPADFEPQRLSAASESSQ